MRAINSVTAVLTAAMLLIASSVPAVADDWRDEREMSTTEKVVAGVAVAAVAGLAIYALTRDDDQDRYDRRDRYDRYDRYDRRDRREYRRPMMAERYEFESYGYDSHDSRRYRGRENEGYWCRVGEHRFYRVPFRYNSRYDRAFNAGWEHGYWAGYVQGIEDARWRSPYADRWNSGGSHWGYAPQYGARDSYSRAFEMAFRVGYRHGFRGERYGHEGFGFGLEIHYRR